MSRAAVVCFRCRHDYRQHDLADAGRCWQPLAGEPCDCTGWAWVDPAGAPATDQLQLPLVTS